jgi:hypothetical protein
VGLQIIKNFIELGRNFQVGVRNLVKLPGPFGIKKGLFTFFIF